MAVVLLALFHQPGVLVALALVAVPILLHLLARRRQHRLAWAAADLLARATAQVRQRFQVKDLILLLLRTAVVTGAVVAVACFWYGRPNPNGSKHSAR